MPMPNQPADHGRRPPSTRRRLWILAAVLAVVGVFFYAPFSDDTEDLPRPGDVAPSAEDALTRALPELVGEWTLLKPEAERALFSQAVDLEAPDAPERREPYYYLMGKVANLPEPVLESVAAAKFLYEDYVQQPEALRGSVVRVAGRLLRLDAVPLDSETAPVLRAWEGLIMDAQAHVYAFVTVTPPPAPILPGQVKPESGIGVRLTGFFLQTTLENKPGSPTRGTATPLIIGRTLRLAAPPPMPHDERGHWQWGLLVVLAVAALGWQVFFRGRRTPPEGRR